MDPDESLQAQTEQMCIAPADSTPAVVPAVSPAPGPRESTNPVLGELSLAGAAIGVGQTFDLDGRAAAVPRRQNMSRAQLAADDAELAAMKQRDADHAGEIAAHEAAVRKSDAPLEDDVLGNMIPGLLLGGFSGLVSGGIKGMTKEMIVHAIHEGSMELTDGPKRE